MSVFDDVRAFRKKFQQPTRRIPGNIPPRMHALNCRLVLEEWEEFHTADNLVDYADAIIDMIYVLVGIGLSHGFPMETLWQDVHRANMAKHKALSSTQKVRKSSKWAERHAPKTEEILTAHGMTSQEKEKFHG